MQQRGRVRRKDARVAIQGREDTFDPAAVRAVAVGAELRITQPATGAEQGLRGKGRGVGHCGHRQLFLACWQRFQIAGNGRQVSIGEMLGAVVNHIDHVARDRGEAVLPGLEQLHGVLHRPQVTQAQRLPLFDRLASQVVLATAAGIAHGFFLESQPARRMA